MRKKHKADEKGKNERKYTRLQNGQIMKSPNCTSFFLKKDVFECDFSIKSHALSAFTHSCLPYQITEPSVQVTRFFSRFLQ